MSRVAFLGLGTMGSGMAATLAKAGHALTVWNRNGEAAKRFATEHKATVAATPAAAVGGADLVLYCLSDDKAVESVVFGSDGVLAGVARGQTVCDLSTVHPDTSRRERSAFDAKGVAFLDTPVFGSKDEAADGKLWVLAGGDRPTFDRVQPVLRQLGETVHYMGDTGAGTSMKLVGNLVVAMQLQALGEAMVLAVKAGLDPADVLGVFKVTDFRSPILAGVGASVIERDFAPKFALRHLLKDANLIDRLATELNSPIPALSAVRETIKSAVNAGWGEEHASAVVKAIERAGATTVAG